MNNTFCALYRAILFASTLSLALAIPSYSQTGIGTLYPDPDKALHVRARVEQHLIRLEGLQLGTAETNVLVTDATGTLSYRPIGDLSTSGEWKNHSSDLYIFANRADSASNSIVVTEMEE